MRDAFIAALEEAAVRDHRVILLAGDIGAIVFDRFRERHPEQFINAGVSEQNMVGVAAGLALAGFRPLVYTIIPFVVMRAFEQIRNDICLPRLPVIVVGVGGGIAYSTLGPTHHAIEDLALMRALPGMTVVVPADPQETMAAVRAGLVHGGPLSLRLGLAGEPCLPEAPAPWEFGRGRILREGTAGTIIACGRCVHFALHCAEQLARAGRSVRVVNMATVKPLDTELLHDCLTQSARLWVYEEHSRIGGLGGAVAEAVTTQTLPCRLRTFSLPDAYCYTYGTAEELYGQYGLLPAQVAAEISADLAAGA